MSIKNTVLLFLITFCSVSVYLLESNKDKVTLAKAYINLPYTADLSMTDTPNNTDEFIETLMLYIDNQQWEELEVPANNNEFKAQESFRVFDNPNTKQYQMQHSGNAWTDEDGFRRYGEEGYYMVAMGSYYTQQCGTILRVTLSSGRQIEVITGDQKSDLHTDAKHQMCKRTDSILEFIVDLEQVCNKAKISGDMSDAKYSDMSGKVIKIERKKFK